MLGDTPLDNNFLRNVDEDQIGLVSPGPPLNPLTLDLFYQYYPEMNLPVAVGGTPLSEYTVFNSMFNQFSNAIYSGYDPITSTGAPFPVSIVPVWGNDLSVPPINYEYQKFDDWNGK